MARGIKVESRGNWISGEGIRVYDRHVASLRRRDLQKIQLKTTIVVTNPDTLNHLTDYRDVHVDTITKSNYFWLNHLASAMNATLAYNVVNSWGYRDKSNGSWSGMMGHLSRKEIDIGGTCMFLTADRMDNVTYIPLATPTRLAFIFRQPPLSFVSNLFTLPFRRSVWIAIGILLSVIVLMLLLASRWEWLTKQTHASEPTLSDNLLLVIGAVAQQGFGFNPLTVPSRIVLLMLLLAVLNLYASYTANIVALLQSTTNSIQTLRDLLESPIKCGAQDIVYNRHYFKLERDPIRRRIIDQKIVPKSGKSNWMTAEEGIGEVRRGFFAFFMEIGPAYRIIQETFEEDEKCGFREMYFIEHFDPMFTVIKQSPYLEIIRVNALKIEESGLKSREMSKFYTKRPPCNGRSKFISVGLNECYFAFYTIACGLLLALGLLVLELLWMKWGSVQRKISE
ncbi:glutamate receptor U1-like [Trichogramma pretiosum]|uniref:glutamate receptor U1-like n=1 Tax=Trichogramma pretiosum TaxID=7493 RepID=UPI0006C98DFA|nr:glutamate receptor U1-like [Trichogramma pretiosum]